VGLAESAAGPAFTPHQREFIEDPLPAYRWLRDDAPVFHVVSEDIWILSRYVDVVAAARDWHTFSQRESVDDEWGAPVKLGPTINTAFRESITALSRATIPLLLLGARL